ncbi:ras and EF-hand domain-containing protein-like [Choloepus didactylus]|uniref:ras and EF-hand domain-containing protein-like n=1 Tax=Choloepus didactylus TaxID=27675 RepID=UPI00189FB2AD|nr:ras and EF-hand domain-containing protein-like [Choloepus didactylus]XP_037652767.1 ras and EF-hand domain-containing protein-like [Choloepus didactylus]XP_037652768.1 ras and EF-hand domain-containing protein-like [Choloepus didactylus]XP_037652769.1 ras and EF-hand domain-containing protein-like [Choloepus didactylus]XP_037652770.1 ras and EF-hand domain-containing protein-like [Choloepus didactylus]XP_037652771.1 ras and EF-hand domain-containing protein-like [Choloepus didactylus]XP_03
MGALLMASCWQGEKIYLIKLASASSSLYEFCHSASNNEMFFVDQDENEALAFGLVYMPQVLTNLGSSCCLIESKELKFSMELADHGLKNREEQVITLYENINLVELRLIQPYEHVITNFICEIKLQSPEMENLAIAVKRAQDKAAMQLSELEEETDQRIQAAEHKTRKEEKRKAE